MFQSIFAITDLYWFEEEGVHDFGGEAHYAKYTFEVFVHGVMVFPPNTTATEQEPEEQLINVQCNRPRQYNKKSFFPF